MKRILLITDGFPYASSEKPFLWTELQYLSRQFDIDIVARTKQENNEAPESTMLPNNVKAYKYPIEDVTGKEKLKYFIKILCSRAWWFELQQLAGEKRRLNLLIDAYEYLVRAILFNDWLDNNLIIDDYDLVYTYWDAYSALAIALKRECHGKIKFITRAHRYDLYNEAASNNRQCFKKYVDSKLDRVCFIADEGLAYYLERFVYKDIIEEKYLLCRLGTVGAKQLPTKSNYRKCLVSCSSLIDRKRVHLIAEALSMIDDIEIDWIHFGDGINYNRLIEMCDSILSDKDNISFKFMGQCDNEEIRLFYDNNYVDAFISTSASEGSPVSIQEALAYGIPIIGTDVGEVAGLTKDSGILLDCNPEISEIADAIKLIFSMNEDSMLALRKNAYDKWKEHYDAEKNAKKFVHMLDQLLEENANQRNE